MESEKSNCQQILDQIELLLDNELKQKEKQDIIQHLEECKHCKDQLEAEKCFKNYLRDNITKKEVSSALVKDIREAVMSGAVA